MVWVARIRSSVSSAFNEIVTNKPAISSALRIIHPSFSAGRFRITHPLHFCTSRQRSRRMPAAAQNVTQNTLQGADCIHRVSV